ncbi:hypothetical protein [Streptosporangium saharense]|uniref:Uncharacterized protein n=1 Tax=Streptosporangium saharense TaxID=1706840 RepID=A0A7W7QR55_9ACTN|nr:hypothetical protein [Streptosporangium saharense]MBB4918098.1 hypothetical protein [Streptosporangium saharense]
MTRSEFDDIRAHIDAEADHPGDLLRVARSLLSDLEDAQAREAMLRAQHLRLLTAARAAAAAEAAGSANPLSFITEELARQGQLPATEVEVDQILLDVRTATTLLARLEQSPTPVTTGSGPRVRRCAGTSRSFPR